MYASKFGVMFVIGLGLEAWSASVSVLLCAPRPTGHKETVYVPQLESTNRSISVYFR
jgi:hypothetical protein